MKRVLLIIMLVGLVFILNGCGNKEISNNKEYKTMLTCTFEENIDEVKSTTKVIMTFNDINQMKKN